MPLLHLVFGCNTHTRTIGVVPVGIFSLGILLSLLGIVDLYLGISVYQEGISYRVKIVIVLTIG